MQTTDSKSTSRDHIHSVVIGEDVAFFVKAKKPLSANRPAISAGEQYVLNRFSYLRRHEGRLLLESPLSDYVVEATSARSAQILSHLAVGVSPQEIAASLNGQTEKVIELFAILLQEQFIAGIAAPERPDLITWEFADLLFHRSSRVMDAAREFATFRFRGRLQAPPPFKQTEGGRIPLQKPDLQSLAKTDPPFTAVLESRKTARIAGEQPVTAEQIAHFLYRVAHIHEVNYEDEMQRMRRPYPSGGGVHELEFYVAVNRCTGLERGIYHYRPDEHCLSKLETSTEVLDRLLARSAAACAMQPNLPDTVVVLTARFSRLAFKYESIAYRLILLHVGVVLQTMYLVATAMGLLPCAMGSGWLRWLGDDTGLDWLAEGAVGEFMLSAG